MQQLETATKSQAKHPWDRCSKNKVMGSTKTQTRACKSCACNLITASGKQASNGLKQANHRSCLSKGQAGIQVVYKLWRYPDHAFPIWLQGIQAPPFQYCFKVSKPCLYNIVSRYPNTTFPILFQGIQTPLFQYCFKISKPSFPI